MHHKSRLPSVASCLVLMCGLSVFLYAQPPVSCTINGIIRGYAPGHAVHIAVYSTADKFARQKFDKAIRIPAQNLPADSLQYTFDSVRPGKYMIAAYQDLNDNKMLDRGLFNRPMEPYCFYKPHAGIFAPDFDQCLFDVTGDMDSAHLIFP